MSCLVSDLNHRGLVSFQRGGFLAPSVHGYDLMSACSGENGQILYYNQGDGYGFAFCSFEASS